MKIKTDKQRMNDAFKRMRALGITAKQRFSCCGSCASYEFGELGANAYAYTTTQDNDFGNYGKLKSRHHIGWFGNGCGEIIKQALEENGFDVIWDGTPEKTVIATLSDIEAKLEERNRHLSS